MDSFEFPELQHDLDRIAKASFAADWRKTPIIETAEAVATDPFRVAFDDGMRVSDEDLDALHGLQRVIKRQVARDEADRDTRSEAAGMFAVLKVLDRFSHEAKDAEPQEMTKVKSIVAREQQADLTSEYFNDPAMDAHEAFRQLIECLHKYVEDDNYRASDGQPWVIVLRDYISKLPKGSTVRDCNKVAVRTCLEHIQQAFGKRSQSTARDAVFCNSSGCEGDRDYKIQREKRDNPPCFGRFRTVIGGTSAYYRARSEGKI